MTSRQGLAVAIALAAAGLYGFVPNFVRGAYLNGVPAIESVLARTALIAVALAGVSLLRQERLRVPKAGRLSFAAQALATLLVSVSYLMSVQFIPVGLAVLIFFTFPIIIMLSAPLVEGHVPDLSRIGIAIAAFGGLAIAIGPNFQSFDVRGLALAALASVACVLQFYSGRWTSRHMPPAVFGSLVHAVIWPVILFVALVFGGGTLRLFSPDDVTPFGYACVIAVGIVYVLAYLMHMTSLTIAPASTVAPFYNLEPVVTTGLAAFALGERLLLNQYVGGAIILASLFGAGALSARKAA